MIDLKGGMVMLKQKQKIWRKNYWEGSIIANELTLFSSLCPFKFWASERNHGPFILGTQKDLMGCGGGVRIKC